MVGSHVEVTLRLDLEDQVNDSKQRTKQRNVEPSRGRERKFSGRKMSTKAEMDKFTSAL